MAKPTRLFNSFAGAMKRDVSRDNLPADTLWNLIDYIPTMLGAPLRKRGGYTHVSQDFSSVTASASYVIAGIYAPYAAGSKHIAFDQNGRGYSIVSSSSSTDLGAVVATRNPVFYSDIVIVPDSAGSVGPKKISSALAVTSLGGSPPAGKYALVYKDVLWLASSSSTSDRIWFATAGQPESTWDLTNKYVDMSYPITGMAALNNAVFVFSLNRTARIRGSIPPPDTDFIIDDPIFDVGCTDNRSIANYRDKVIWANAQGLFISDGTAMDDLTAICGQKNWWLDVMAGRDGINSGTAYDPSTFTIAGGIHRDFYIYCVLNGATHVDAGIIDLKKFTWTRMNNIGATSMWRQTYPEELFFGRRGAARVGGFAGLWTPTSASSADANGTAITPLFETGFMGAQDGAMKNMRQVLLEYDLRDPGSSAPTFTLAYILSPEATSYTTLSPTAPATTAIDKMHCPINRPARGIAFKVTQTNASSDSRVYGLDLYAGAREGNR